MIIYHDIISAALKVVEPETTKKKHTQSTWLKGASERKIDRMKQQQQRRNKFRK